MKTTMPAQTALYLIDAMLAATATTEYTPILQAARLTREGRALRAVSTDRYRIHEVTLHDATTTTSAKGEQVIVPAAMLRRIKRGVGMVAPRRTDRANTKLTLSTRKTTVSGIERTLITAMIEVDGVPALTLFDYAELGNYPPLERLIEEATEADHYTGDVSLNLAYLGKMQALNPSVHGAAVVKHSVRADRPGIVIATYEAAGITARGFLQPNLLLR